MTSGGFRALAAVCVAAAMLSACSGASTTDDGPGLDARADSIERELSMAQTGGASEMQIQVLRSGTVDFGAVQAAVSRTVECARAAGIAIDGPTVTNYQGFPDLTYGFATTSQGRSAAETEEISNACQRQHSTFIEHYYRNGPQAIAAKVALMDKYRPAILDCLRANGRALADSASPAAILNAMDRLRADRLGDPAADCYTRTGFLVPSDAR